MCRDLRAGVEVPLDDGGVGEGLGDGTDELDEDGLETELMEVLCEIGLETSALWWE